MLFDYDRLRYHSRTYRLLRVSGRSRFLSGAGALLARIFFWLFLFFLFSLFFYEVFSFFIDVDDCCLPSPSVEKVLVFPVENNNY